MDTDYNRIKGEVVRDMDSFEIIDILPFLRKYFSCGYSHDRYYNYNYGIALSIIGKLYNQDSGRSSDYKKGIKYISKRLGVSVREVKSIGKKYKVWGGYEFKTPYKISKILKEIINLLKSYENEKLVSDLMKENNETLYRRVLIGKLYNEIKISAKDGEREKVIYVEGELDHLTQEFKG